MLRGILRYLQAVLCLAGVLCAADSGVWLDVPFVKQEKNGCGAASVAMVLQYWQRQQRRAPDADAHAEQIQRMLYSSRAHGIYASDLEKYFRWQGFQTFTFRGRWDDLKHHLQKGRPLIVALKPGHGLPLHYVVLSGVDLQQGFVLKNDPAERKLLKQSRSEFEKEWKAAGDWTLLALPGDAQSSTP